MGKALHNKGAKQCFHQHHWLLCPGCLFLINKESSTGSQVIPRSPHKVLIRGQASISDSALLKHLFFLKKLI